MHDARELRSAVYTVKYRTGWSCTEIALTIFSTEPVHFYEVLPWEWHIHKLSTVPCNSAPCLSKYLLGSSAPELLSTENKYTWLLCTRALFISIKISFWRTGWFLIMRKKCHLFFFLSGLTTFSHSSPFLAPISSHLESLFLFFLSRCNQLKHYHWEHLNAGNIKDSVRML